MRRFVFQPRWMLGHLLVLAAALACLWLGDWQWGRAHVTGSAQNWGYAFQWPLFAVCFLVGWWRMLGLESLRLDEQTGDGGESPLHTPVLAPPPVETPPQPQRAQAADPDDERLAAYNRMLAALAAQDARNRR